MFSTNILLGAIAGITIFLGLPIARWRKMSERMRGLLTLASAGVLVFLVVDIGYQALESVEVTAKSGSIGDTAWQVLILFVGFALGLIGLAWLEERRHKKREAGAEALETATMIAVGIGLHNFAEGLAIGQSFAGGAVGLGTVLVAGFALHNATEGFGIAGPLAGHKVSWTRLLWLGLIAGAPTAIGAALGGVWVNRSIELLFLSLAIGSLIYVTRELFRLRFATLGAVAAMTAVTFGFFLGFGTELVASVGQSGVLQQNTANTSGGETLLFSNKQAAPAALTLERGKSLTIENGENVPLVFEGNGMYPGEVVVAPGGKVTIAATGLEGQYKIADERGQSGTATVTLQASGTVEPLSNEVNAVGALTVLEGHVRASKDLHERGISNQGPDSSLDLKRAGKHAGHPQKELLLGSDPDALNLQKLLRQRGVFDSLNNALTEYVNVAGKSEIPAEEVERKYKTALAETERARRTIGGDAYDTPDFRARVARFVLDTTAGEYATATEGGRVAVIEAGTPGKDNFIEYQDGRGFLKALEDFLASSSVKMSPDAQAAFDKLTNEVFSTLDPTNPDNPVPAAEIKALTDRAGRGLS